MTFPIEHPPRHTNRLVNETSPYLLQHAHNPVDWHPWGQEALAAAQREDKPIFLSIGYSACHWCHVMERESFENETVAALMNERFINIKVDREERPDLDSIYMDAVQAMTGQGGWPMSVFLTPSGEPFFGGTYFPPEPRYGMASWTQVLNSVSDAWNKRRDQVEGQAGRLTEMLRRSASIGAQQKEQGGDIGAETLDAAIERLSHHFDSEDGGFGDQPKFPQPMTLDFCLAYFARTGDEEALFMAELTLQNMAQGGIYDQLGGGFHRYSVDAYWLVPHFEKMLYDNAQLLRTYLHAWQITGRPLYRRVLNETIAWVQREMTAPEGGFYSTQDADSEGEEGKFFVWTPEEIASLLAFDDATLFMAWYDVTPQGNFEGKNILNVVGSPEKATEVLGISAEEVEERLMRSRQILFGAREQRVRPARDEKILVEWNGLMIHALAECGAVLADATALEMAQYAARFVLDSMSQPDGRLYRSFKDGRARFNAYLEDYAAFIRGLLALYEADFDLRWLAEASRLTQVVFDQFHDGENGGFFQTGVDHETLIARRKDYVDNAIPSGNSMMAEALQRLSVLVGNDAYRREASRIALSMKSAMENQPSGFGRMLCVTNALVTPSQEVAIVGNFDDAATQALLAEARRHFLPNTVLAATEPDAKTILPLLEGRGLVGDKPAAYVCENYACKLPVTTVEALADLLI